MFIGVITDMVLKSLNQDVTVGTFVGLKDAAVEVGKICNAYKDADIDLTVLLTHIGFESDKELAALLDPAWGVDLIIGGHSHTILEQPAKVNDILVVQAGTGTDQIGRFDITVDDDSRYSIAVQGYHYKNSESNLGLSNASLTELDGSQVVTTSVRDVRDEYLRSHQNLNAQVEGRLQYR